MRSQRARMYKRPEKYKMLEVPAAQAIAESSNRIPRQVPGTRKAVQRVVFYYSAP